MVFYVLTLLVVIRLQIPGWTDQWLLRERNLERNNHCSDSSSGSDPKACLPCTLAADTEVGFYMVFSGVRPSHPVSS